MKKTILKIKGILIVITLFVLTALVYSFFALPDEICKIPEENIKISSIYSLRVVGDDAFQEDCETLKSLGEYEARVSLFKTIPVKSVSLKVSQRKYVVASGEIFGLRLFTKGIVVVETENVITEDGTRNPAKEAGLKVGDLILKVNSTKINSCLQLTEIFSAMNSEPFALTYSRDGVEKTTNYSLAYSKNDQKYMAGLWVKDSAAGIGTMTFFDPQTNTYGGLGHAICDVETGKILPLSEGDIVEAKISGCYKGKSGQAGELCGTFCGGTTGSIEINNQCGVFGKIFKTQKSSNLTPVALKSEVEEGAAYILSTIDGNEPESFSVFIEEIDYNDKEYRNFVIRVTDDELISRTGGIVQGMSGSPIIQNGKLIGAVTHVLVNDPTRGYGIFIENMMKNANMVDELLTREAS